MGGFLDFKTGLQNKEFYMWVTSEPPSAEHAAKSLKQAVPDMDDYIQKGQIEILEYSDWYTKSGSFEADKVLQDWVEKNDQAVKKDLMDFVLQEIHFGLRGETGKNSLIMKEL